MSNTRGIIGIIEDELASRGFVSFARFMELALYCPNFGYYEQSGESPGRAGDYFTSVSVGPMFGELLATRFAGWLGKIPGPGRQIVEAGAHDGRLAREILRRLQTNHPAACESLNYWILEPSAVRRQSQQETLKEFAGRVQWFGSWDEVPSSGVRGVVFSNELLDAMPVHRLGWDARARKWFEWGVTLEQGCLAWTKHSEPGAGVPIPVLPETLLAVLPDGFTTEVCPAAVAWWRSAAEILRDGKLLTLDYGLTSEQFFAPERHNGTMRAYHRHHATADLLAHPGEQDLTASVNFTAIRDIGESAGLTTETFATQAQFLTGIISTLANDPKNKEWLAAGSRQFQTLTHPEHLGQKFRVLVQTR